jgi:hypothetical protein
MARSGAASGSTHVSTKRQPKCLFNSFDLRTILRGMRYIRNRDNAPWLPWLPMGRQQPQCCRHRVGCDMSRTLAHSTALLHSMALCAGNLASSSIAGLAARACCLRCWPGSVAVAAPPGASMITSRCDAASCCHSCANDRDMAG